MTSGVKRNTIEIKKMVKDRGYKLIDTYFKKSDLKHMRIIVEDNQKYKYDLCFDNFLNKNREPRFVDKGNMFSLGNIKLWMSRNRRGFALCDENVYLGSKGKLKIYHNICNEYSLINWNNIYQGSGCPVCGGRQVGKYNNLSYLRPELVKEWHPDNSITPKEVTIKSNKKVYWICSDCKYGENLEWLSKISNRTNGRECPVCSIPQKVVTDKNRLSVRYPKIVNEWHPIKNGNLIPENVPYGSDKKYWWICPSGHEYNASINNRTNKSGIGCKICSDEQKESYVATELKRWCKENFKDVDIEHKMFKNPETNCWLRCDIYIGKPNTENGTYIEINGGQHYKFHSRYHKTEAVFKYNKKLDKIKKIFARKNGVYIEIDLRKRKTVKDWIEHIIAS